jgi:hypothetical protein
MGDLHKFKRPPKNEQQFKGYRPQSAKGPARRPDRRPLRGWQRSVIAWCVLVMLAIGIWAISSSVSSS